MFRSLRVRLPQPWALRVGQAAHLPRLVRGDAATRIAFAEERLIERLVSDDAPLDGVGVGLSERVIEIPWILRALPSNPGARVLDVGTAFAPVVYKRLLVRLAQRVETVDLAPTDLPGIVSHVADVRSLPFGDAAFDAATCISTLEHIGMDNAHYNVASGGAGDVEAMRELGRVARRVLITVPGGRDADLGWLRQYSPETFRGRVQRAGLSVLRFEVYAHDARRGWERVDEQAVGERQFGEGVFAASAVICVELCGPGDGR